MKYFSLVAIALLMAGCGGKEDAAPTADAPAPAGDSPSVANTTEPETTSSAEATAGAAVQLSPTQGNTANGGLKITAAGAGVKISGMIQGLKPDSEFGFHFHEKGDCSAPDATSAGAHFNPGNQQHGNPQAQPHHAGDMLNVKSDAQGVAEVSVDNADVSLQTGQPNDILGKALVLHAKPDDYKTQPSGDSGDRIACGVVAIQTN
ncbi:superoxide dismutase family protein [Steroidobacter sp. S1-65]|uniref:Superoxide dismutase [Cu-Zn] n=1 Tax=Steroidobacter gossypii TaxID=2805490 RepID=A0ABS1X3E3_9GAMM|nr:superoxide dismutase family protein [Steroidobacter gossypii]MBM0107736.1 superoxide dismutase family protein [Steroidobacter gossypii]